jgi:hypothetical protein
VHEHIFAAVVRLDESIALLLVEPFNGALFHGADLSLSSTLQVQGIRAPAGYSIKQESEACAVR